MHSVTLFFLFLNSADIAKILLFMTDFISINFDFLYNNIMLNVKKKPFYIGVCMIIYLFAFKTILLTHHR